MKKRYEGRPSFDGVSMLASDALGMTPAATFCLLLAIAHSMQEPYGRWQTAGDEPPHGCVHVLIER